MAVNSVLTPYPVFTDASGVALENGYIFIGQPGFEARTSPKASYFDVAQTIPTGTASGAAIRTRGGMPINTSNSPAMFYVDGDFSISVLDRNMALLYSSLNTTLALNVGGAIGPILAPDGNLGATGFGFINETNTGLVRSATGTVQDVVQGVVVATKTTAGTVFSQPVSGSGFSSGVLAIAQPLDGDLTALAGIAGVEGDLIYRNATQWTRLAKGSSEDRILKQNVGLTAPAWTVPDICRELGVAATTSGTSVALSGLDLTSYKMLVLCVNNVSWTASESLAINGTTFGAATGSAAFARIGHILIDLASSTFTAATANGGSAGTLAMGTCTINTATTTLTFTGAGGGTFDLGSIRVLGVR
jgi:hypothetical protein